MTLCSRPRHEAALKTVGVELLALHALSPLGFAQKLAKLGINGALRAAILGNFIGRMAELASELSIWNGLQTQSALDELFDVDFVGLSPMRLYRASDVLMRPQEGLLGCAIAPRLKRICSVPFALQPGRNRHSV